MAEVVVRHQAQVVTRLFREVCSTHTQRDVLHQLMLLVSKARWLDDANLHVALHHVSRDGVHHVGRAWSDDEQLLVLSDDGLEHVLNLQYVANLSVGHKDVCVLKDTLIFLVVVDE